MAAPDPADWLRANVRTQRLSDRDILRLLQESLVDVRRLLRAWGARDGFSAKVRADQLRVVERELLRQQAEVMRKVGQVIAARRAEAAARAVVLSGQLDAALLERAGATGQANALLAAVESGAADTAAVAIARMEASAVPLSQRIYNTNLLMSGRIDRMINSALASGLSAREFAAQAIDWFNPGTRGGARYAAMRLARTEINNAFHFMSIDRNDKPWVKAMHWNLSRSHPRPDDCDKFATQDAYGLGAGRYPVRNTPKKPHPQCFCYVTPETVSEDEFLDGLLAGKYDDHLGARGLGRMGAPREIRTVANPHPRADISKWIRDAAADPKGLRKQAESMWNFVDGKTGLRSSVVSTSDLITGKVRAHISIKDASGKQVGSALRSIARDADGRLYVSQDSFWLDREVQGGGFATRWLADQEAAYRSVGAEYMLLEADIDVGGYAWAKKGFDFFDDGQAKIIANRFEKNLVTQGIDPKSALYREVQDLIARASRGGTDRPLPLEFALLGWTDGAQSWFGKQVMLGSDWIGRKPL